MRYLIIFLFLTGCFKDALENCADENIKSKSLFNRKEITKTVKLTTDEKYQKEIDYQTKIKELKNKYPNRYVCTKSISKYVNLYNSGASLSITTPVNEKNIEKYRNACSEMYQYNINEYLAEAEKNIDTKTVVVKEISREENERNYNKFIRKNLKNKMNTKDYEA